MGKLKEFFSPDFNKSGKGVDENEALKPGYVRVWQLYFRNFNRMLFYGVIIGLVALPLVIYVFSFATLSDKSLMENLQFVLEQRELDPNFDGTIEITNVWVAFVIPLVLRIPEKVVLVVLAACAVLLGPMTCGLTFCLRNHAREDHTWFSDLFSRAWRNKWQGLFFGLFDVLIHYSLLYYLFVLEPGENTATNWLFILQVMIIAVYVIYSVMRIYIYQMIVTFNLKLGGLLKNAWMFVILGFKRNVAALLSTVLLILAFYGVPVMFPSIMPLFLVLTVMFSCSLIPFVQVYATYPVMHKYLVEPALKEQAAREGRKYKNRFKDALKDKKQPAPPREEKGDE